jgi:probable HAF family extracellular repeat protein
MQVGGYKSSDFRLEPVLWRDNHALELTLPRGYDSGLGLVVNSEGTVAGVAATNSLFAYFLWPGTEFQDQEHPNLNLVMWFNRRPVALRHPYVDLLDPPYRRSTIPHDINASGDVVGQTHTVYNGTTHDRRAFAYSDGRLFDLNRSFQEEEVQIKLTNATGIADDGSILAEGVRILGHPDEGETAYVYLQPIS